MDAILEIRDLTTTFKTSQGTYSAIKDVNLSIAPGELVGIVGQSGCGKSVTFMSCMRLLDERTVKYSGEVLFEGKNVFSLSERQMRRVRGKNIAMIFQEPMTCLNPLHKIGRQIIEVYEIHTDLTKQDMYAKALDLLELVGITDAKKRMEQYPHELSGGMRQRVMIAIALACEPQLLVADEPTTALDVTIQIQILSLMKALQKKTGTAIVLIAHDLGVIANMVDRVVVMYAGEVVEEGTTRQIFKEPLHPYTQGLLQAVPRLDEDRETLFSIEGRVPPISEMPEYCRFADRCDYCTQACRAAPVALVALGDGRRVRCIRYKEEGTKDG